MTSEQHRQRNYKEAMKRTFTHLVKLFLVNIRSIDTGSCPTATKGLYQVSEAQEGSFKVR